MFLVKYLFLDSHLDRRTRHVVDDLQLVVDHLCLHLLGRGSWKCHCENSVFSKSISLTILGLVDPGGLPLVFGLPNNTLTSNNTLPGA